MGFEQFNLKTLVVGLLNLLQKLQQIWSVLRNKLRYHQKTAFAKEKPEGIPTIIQKKKTLWKAKTLWKVSSAYKDGMISSKLYEKLEKIMGRSSHHIPSLPMENHDLSSW